MRTLSLLEKQTNFVFVYYRTKIWLKPEPHSHSAKLYHKSQSKKENVYFWTNLNRVRFYSKELKGWDAPGLSTLVDCIKKIKRYYSMYDET